MQNSFFRRLHQSFVPINDFGTPYGSVLADRNQEINHARNALIPRFFWIYRIYFMYEMTAGLVAAFRARVSQTNSGLPEGVSAFSKKTKRAVHIDERIHPTAIAHRDLASEILTRSVLIIFKF